MRLKGLAKVVKQLHGLSTGVQYAVIAVIALNCVIVGIVGVIAVLSF